MDWSVFFFVLGFLCLSVTVVWIGSWHIGSSASTSKTGDTGQRLRAKFKMNSSPLTSVLSSIQAKHFDPAYVTSDGWESFEIRRSLNHISYWSFNTIKTLGLELGMVKKAQRKWDRNIKNKRKYKILHTFTFNVIFTYKPKVQVHCHSTVLYQIHFLGWDVSYITAAFFLYLFI